MAFLLLGVEGCEEKGMRGALNKFSVRTRKNVVYYLNVYLYREKSEEIDFECSYQRRKIKKTGNL